MSPCRQCGATNRNATGGCRPCRAKNARRRYALNPQVGREYARRWRLANPEAARMQVRRKNCLYAGWAPGEFARAEAIRKTITACDCCGSALPRSRTGWQADHNHTTGKFRAFVCQPCNVQLGHTETFGMAPSSPVANYLERYA